MWANLRTYVCKYIYDTCTCMYMCLCVCVCVCERIHGSMDVYVIIHVDM